MSLGSDLSDPPLPTTFEKLLTTETTRVPVDCGSSVTMRPIKTRVARDSPSTNQKREDRRAPNPMFAHIGGDQPTNNNFTDNRDERGCTNDRPCFGKQS